MKTKTSQGSALLLSTILLFVVLSMVVSLSYVTVMEQQMSSKTKSSVGSFFNADSGVEWALNKIAASTDDTATILDAFGGSSNFEDNAAKCPFGTDSCKVYFLDQDGKVLANTATLDQIKAVRSIGTQGGETQRAIEAAVAATGDYQLSCVDFAGFFVCCKMDTSTGATTCKYTPNQTSSWINFPTTGSSIPW